MAARERDCTCRARAGGFAVGRPPCGHRHAPLHAHAEQALAQCCSPCSPFRMGAFLRSASGALHGGCTGECAACTLATCAERSAIVAAECAEGPNVQLVERVVVAGNAEGEGQPASPCGACRQLIRASGQSSVVHFRNADGHWQQATIEALLPGGFRLTVQGRVALRRTRPAHAPAQR